MLKGLESMNTNWTTEDIASGDWDKTYKFDQKAPLTFRIIDNGVFIKNIQRELRENTDFLNRYSQNLSFLNSLEEIKLWIKTDTFVLPMTLLDIYHSFVRNLKDESFDDQLYNCSEVSFMGALGPFKEVALIECLNDKMIQKFLFNYSVKSKMPTRKLRIRTNGNIMVSHGEKFDSKSNIQIKQITDSGILFSSKDEFVIDDLSRSNTLKFHINTKNLKQFTENDFKMNTEANEEFFYSRDELMYFFVEEEKIQRSLSYHSHKTNEFFLFVRYFDMLDSDVPAVFKAFTDKADEYFKHFIEAA